ncbi:MAG TPA: alpha/beta fold hydrolase [Candidatus Dormibacteraeota bacterium]
MALHDRLDKNSVGLHYLRWNSEAGVTPPILLLHGLSSNAAFWGRLAAQLPGRRLIALDQRAHGASAAPEIGYEPATLAADAAGLVEELGLGRVVVAGHSWGATIALQLAADRPDLVSGLAVVDGPVRPWSETGLTWEQAEKFMQPPLPLYGDLEQAVAEKRGVLKAAWGDDLVDFVRAGLVEEAGRLRLPLTAGIRLQILRAMFFQPYGVLWPQVRCPVLLALAAGGEESMFADFKKSSAALIAEQVPGTVVHWYRSGHDVPIEQPAELAADLERLCLRAAFADVTADIAASEGDWAVPTGYLDWTAKDLLAHLSSTQAALPVVARSREGEGEAAAEQFDSDRWNASQLRRRRDLPAEDLIGELRTSAAELDGVLAELPLDKLIGSGPYAGETAAAVMGNMVDHQREHLAELRRSLAPSAGSAKLPPT